MSEKNRDTYQVRSSMSNFKTRKDDGKLYISAYFSVFNSEYKMFDGYIERVAPEAFDETLASDIRCLIDHETRLVLGRTKSGTLTLKVDNRGLWGEVEINPNDQDAMNLYERVKRGDVDQCSFGFDILEEDFEDLGNVVRWTIKKVKLYEVSIVTFPAYEETSATARKNELAEIRKRKVGLWKNKMMSKLKGE